MSVSFNPYATALLLAAGVLSAPNAIAQTAESAANTPPDRQTADPGALEAVIVRGQRMSEIEFDLEAYVRNFLTEVVALPPGGGHARWHGGLCTGVTNLDRSAAQYLADRIARLALEVQLEPGEPGCRPNVIVIFTTDADELAAHLAATQPLLFRPGGSVCCMQLGLDALDEFVHSDKPVRWWHVSMPVDPNLRQRAIHLPQDGVGEHPIITVFGPSRIHSGVVDQMERVVMIVDGTQLSGTSWKALGDYLAVIALAQINPRANLTEFDSILNLFSNPAAYSGLTDWDVAYIQTLYEVNMERLTKLQANLLVERMLVKEREFSE